jgi:CW_7 repeat
MAYFLAPSLVSLRNELNAAHPNRDKSSDGWVGDTAHQARKSDHNPDYSAGGIVRAIDIDKDGIDVNKLLYAATHSPVVEYVIWNGGIYTRQNGFRRAVYTGTNPHDKHVHISIRHTVAAASARSWGYWHGGAAVSTAKPAAAPAPAKASITTIARQVLAGQWGNNPTRGQRLAAAGYNPTAVQAEVNRLLGGGGGGAVRLSIGVLAQQVIAGQWGNGTERQRRITAAGYDYNAVRAEVNRRLG